MTFERLNVFNSKREGIIAFGILGLIFCLHVGFKFYEYKNFLSQNIHYEGEVLSRYQKTNKNNKTYEVLKISTKNHTIYTTLWKKSLHVKQRDRISFKISKKNISFLDFLSNRFYAPIYALHVKDIKKNTLKVKLINFIYSQHKSEDMKQLYSALFLASPINKNLRVKIQHWGISHLVAISGFHLGVIYGFLFFIFKIIYGFFQDKYFPYKDANFHIGLILFSILAFYAYLIDFAPSFLRAFVMSLLGFFFYLRYFKVLSFTTLSLTIAILLAFFPDLVLSIGFWFSVMGVFYIFLYVHHFKFKWYDTIFLNIWVFLAMVIPVHFWFAYTSWQQFSSIILSIVFIVFYPLILCLHVIGYGGIFDEILEKFLNISFEGKEIFTPFWLFILYIALSIFSIFNRYLAIFTVGLGFLYFLMILY